MCTIFVFHLLALCSHSFWVRRFMNGIIHWAAFFYIAFIEKQREKKAGEKLLSLKYALLPFFPLIFFLFVLRNGHGVYLKIVILLPLFSLLHWILCSKRYIVCVICNITELCVSCFVGFFLVEALAKLCVSLSTTCHYNPAFKLVSCFRTRLFPNALSQAISSKPGFHSSLKNVD